jgi:allophanate hydrolase subunit 1
MLSQTLQLATPITKESAAQLTQTLQAIAGIGSIAFAPAANQLKVTFDEGHTSVQELTNIITKAGYKVDQSARREAEKGGCCGGGCS